MSIGKVKVTSQIACAILMLCASLSVGETRRSQLYLSGGSEILIFKGPVVADGSVTLSHFYIGNDFYVHQKTVVFRLIPHEKDVFDMRGLSDANCFLRRLITGSIKIHCYHWEHEQLMSPVTPDEAAKDVLDLRREAARERGS